MNRKKSFYFLPDYAVTETVSQNEYNNENNFFIVNDYLF